LGKHLENPAQRLGHALEAFAVWHNTPPASLSADWPNCDLQ
jgi:hypothetical protein